MKTAASPKASAVDVSLTGVRLHEPVNIISMIYDAKETSAFIKAIEARTARVLRSRPMDAELLIHVSIHRNRRAAFTIAARPPLKTETRKLLLAGYRTLSAPRPKLVDGSFHVTLKVNGGCLDSKLKFAPRIENPLAARGLQFAKMSMAKKVQYLRQWARESVLPPLATIATRVSPRFKGVRATGRLVLDLEHHSPLNTSMLTELSPSYWRAVMEMARGDQHILTIRIFLHTADGDLDIARRLVEMAIPFSKSKTASNYYLRQLRLLLRIFYRELNTRIHRGIAHHDKKEYARALAVYDKVLQEYPNSAMALYERYFTAFSRKHNINSFRHSDDPTKHNILVVKKKVKSRNTKKDKEISRKIDKEVFSLWRKAKAKIYRADPLFATGSKAATGREIYLLFRRMKLRGLFKEKNSFKKDLIEYADIALDLGAYSFASQLYWSIVTYIDPAAHGSRDMLGHFLYCLEKLNVKELKKVYKGNLQRSFKTIARERRKLMESNKLFKSAAKKY